jgi:thioester reductase-like protein
MRRITGRCSLTESIDTFIHCGARVQYLCDYQTLKPANVDSTVEVLRFLLQSPTMSRFLYVSGGDAPNIETGHASSAERFAHMNGYSQSKFVSELVVANCARLELFKGKQLRIVKPGYIIGSVSQPRAAQTDFLWRLVSSCLNMKAYNGETLSQWLYMSDIEYVAQLVIDGVFNSAAADYLPALDGLSLGDLWELLKTELGYHLEANSEAKWFQILEREIFRQQESHPLFPFLSVLKREIGLFGSQGTQKVSNDRVKQAVLKNVQYLIDTGSIHSPHS